jgi:transcriptional regulator with XRE-family HTH domain
VKGYRTRWALPDERRASPEYVEAGARIALGQAVYDRRVALGLSQAELAARAGTTQTVISRLEGGAVTPTLPLLHRLAGALEGELDIKITGTSTRAEFPLASWPARLLKLVAEALLVSSRALSVRSAVAVRRTGRGSVAGAWSVR